MSVKKDKTNMKISVCFKVVPDYDKVPKTDWEKPDRLDFEYVKKIFGVFDEGALECALSLKDEYRKTGEPCFAEAVTYGQPDEIFASTLYAVGFDRVVEIHGKDSDFSPEHTAAALAGYLGDDSAAIGNLGSTSTLKGDGSADMGNLGSASALKGDGSADMGNLGSISVLNEYPGEGSTTIGNSSSDATPDIILLGKMTGPNDSGTVPYYLAQKLGLPVINQMCEIRLEDGCPVIIRREADRIEKYIFKTPVVAIAEDVRKPYLRMYTLLSMMENKGKKPETIKYRGKPAGRNKIKIVCPEKRSGSCEYKNMEGREAAEYLLDEIRKAGNPENEGSHYRPGEIKTAKGFEICRTDDFKEKPGTDCIKAKNAETIDISWNEIGMEQYGSTKDKVPGIREVYSGYLGLKEKVPVFAGNPKSELPKAAEELCKELAEKQTAYKLPDKTEKAAGNGYSLSEADVVIAFGRGVGNSVNYKAFKEKAQKSGVAVGCTRLAAMSGYEDYSQVIGISGQSLKAKLCICVGVSGAGPFVKGLKDVEKVIAVNNDRDALIFDRADVGIVCDAQKIMDFI